MDDDAMDLARDGSRGDACAMDAFAMDTIAMDATQLNTVDAADSDRSSTPPMPLHYQPFWLPLPQQHVLGLLGQQHPPTPMLQHVAPIMDVHHTAQVAVSSVVGSASVASNKDVVTKAGKKRTNSHSHVPSRSIAKSSLSSVQPSQPPSNLPRKNQAAEDTELPIAPAARRVTMWQQTDAGFEPLHGFAKELFPDGSARIALDPTEGAEVSSSSSIVTWERDSWCWGEHRRRPSLLGREAAKTAAFEAVWNPRSSAPVPSKASSECPEVDATRAACAGERAWAPAFLRCIDALAVLQSLVLEAGWPHRAPSMWPEELHASWLDQLNSGGMTALVNGSIRLLKRVPTPKHWDSKVWPSHGDWSKRLIESNQPKDLLEHLLLARERVILWPVNMKEALEARERLSLRIVPAVITSPCFVCGHASSVPHPALGGKRLCEQCHKRYSNADWIEDDELLDLICGGCAHSGGTPHGCRDCGASLCERCLYSVSGSRALNDARRHRFHPEYCPGCGLEECQLATCSNTGFDSSLRVVCDACKQEWHPSCHTPQLTAIPGLSTRWTCSDCELMGEPQTVAWSHGGCHLCDASRVSALRCVARTRTWMRGVRLALGGVAPRCEQARPLDFDHPKALQKLNNNIRETNQLLSECPISLGTSALRKTARLAAEAGGVTVVSYCDGKGSLLGFFLRAGMRIRRYLSVELESNCNRVCRTLYGASWEQMEPSALRFFRDARELTVAKLRSLDCWPVHFLMGATPCQDLSACNASGQGLEGPQSRLFVDFCEFHKALREDNNGVPLVVLAENVVPANKADELEMTRLLGVPPLHSEAAVFEAARRPRLLFSNLPFVPVSLDTPNKTLQSILNPGAVALATKAGCIITGRLEGKYDSIATAKDHMHRNRGRTLVLCSPHSTDVRGLVIPELARALGQPHYEVDSASGSESDRAALLGRSLAAGQIMHASQAFTDAVLNAQRLIEVDAGGGATVGVTRAPSQAQWAQCEDCQKWRRLPAGENVEGVVRWTCRDSMLGMCEAPQDVLGDNEDDWQ